MQDLQIHRRSIRKIPCVASGNMNSTSVMGMLASKSKICSCPVSDYMTVVILHILLSGILFRSTVERYNSALIEKLLVIIQSSRSAM